MYKYKNSQISIFRIAVIFEIVNKNTIEAITNKIEKRVKKDEKKLSIRYLFNLSI